jgi:hypothetical protein
MIKITLLIIFLLFLYYRELNYIENFSSSGLALSNLDCDKLAYIYNRPYIIDPKKRAIYKSDFCDVSRKNSPYYETSDFDTSYGYFL